MDEEGKVYFGYDEESNQPIVTYTNRIGKTYTMSACLFDKMIKEIAATVDRTPDFTRDRDRIAQSRDIPDEIATPLTELLYAHSVNIEDFIFFTRGGHFVTVKGQWLICPHCSRIVRIKPQQDVDEYTCPDCESDVWTYGVIHQ